jgi:hypothetical protein
MPEQIVDRITRHVDSAYAEGLRRADAFRSRLQVQCGHRCFVVARMGSTGSTWLAKLLNSHPDVFCSHERVVSHVFPATGFDASDLEHLIELLASDCMHGAYEAAGDVGSVWLGYAVALQGKFTTGLLARHPARVVNTRLTTRGLSFTVISPEARSCIEALWGISLDSMDPIDQAFVHDLHTFASQVRGIDRIDCVMRIEDLLDAGHCREALATLTGIEYREDLITGALACRTNTRATRRSVPEIVEAFTPDQRRWYEHILADVAPHFGYDLFSDRTSEPAFPASDAGVVSDTVATPGPGRQADGRAGRAAAHAGIGSR